jgi:hypothetical protein
LDKHDQVIYLGLHALKHNVERLLWLADIRNLVIHWKAPDWEVLMERAKKWGQERSILHIYFLLHHLLGFAPPEESRRLLERKRLHALEERVLRQRIDKEALPVWAHLLLFSPGKGIHKTIPYVLETLFPRPHILRQIFQDSPGSKVWELYFMRLLQILGKLKMCMKGP